MLTRLGLRPPQLQIICLLSHANPLCGIIFDHFPASSMFDFIRNRIARELGGPA